MTARGIDIPMSAGRLRSLFSILLALVGERMIGQTTVPPLTWSNNSVSSSFTAAASWVGGAGSSSFPDASTPVQFMSTGQPVVQPVLSTQATVLGMTFLQTSPSYNLTTQLTSGVSLSVGQLGIVNQSSLAQTIAVPLILSGGTGTNVTPVPVSSNGSGALFLSGPVAVGAAGVSFGSSSGGSGVVSGVVTSVAQTAGKLTVAGGTWSFSGANTFTGPVEITGGTMVLASSGALPASRPLLLNPAAGLFATLDIAGQSSVTAGTLTFRGSGYSSSSISLSSSALLNLTGNLVYDASGRPGMASITGGTLALGATTRTFLVGAGQGYATPSITDLSISSNISGSGGISKQGVGTLALSGTNSTFSGPLVINEGAVVLGASGALPAGTAVTVDAASGVASLVLGGSSQSISSLTLGASNRQARALNVVEVGQGGVLSLGSSTAGQLTVYGTGVGPSARIGDSFTTGSGQLNFNSGGVINVLRNNAAATSVVDLIVTTSIAGSLAVQKNGPGAMLLEGSGSLLTGALNVNQGTVLLGAFFASSATNGAGGAVVVGSGAAIAAGRYVSAFYDEHVLAKAVTLNSGAQLGSWDLDQDIRLNLAGAVTLQPAANSSVVTLGLAGDEGNVISGAVNSTTAGTAVNLVNIGTGRRGLLALSGPIGQNIGSLTVDGAGLMLSTVPVSAVLNVTGGGYLGVAPAALKGPAPAVQGVIDRVGVNKATFSGTFGFDSFLDDTTPQVFADSVSFANFSANLTLGSMTGAILTGAITPPGSVYAFGNGGGVLILRGGAALTDAPGGGARSLSVVSSSAVQDNALALVLQAASSFSGGVRVANSRLLLDAAGALPAGSRPMSLEAGGYLGFTENAGMSGPGGFRSLLSPANFSTLTLDPTAVLGLDSAQFIADKIANSNISPTATRFISDKLDFSQLGPVGVGTVTRATLLGSLVGQVSGNARSLRLLGVEGGVLEIRSRVSDANAASLTVGGTSLLHANGKVVLAAQNTYSGGTTLVSGTLVAGTSQRVSRGTVVSGPLGLGAVTVPADALSPTLSAGGSSLATLGNNFLLGSRLALGAFDGSAVYNPASLSLTGTIANLSATNTGGLDVYGDVTLRGTNTFSGGVNLYNGVIYLGSSSSGTAGGPLGTGTLKVSPVAGSYSVGLAALGPQTLDNPLVLEVSSPSRFSVFGTGSLTLAGPVSLNAPVEFYVGSQPLYLTGQISGFGSLGSSPGSNGTIVLNPAGGANTFTGGVANYSGRIVFASAASIPAGAVLAPGSDGYTGYATGYVPGASFQNDFLAKFDRAGTFGTIGLDTLINGKLALGPTQGTPNLFSDQIDLTGFGSAAKIGSTSTAVLSGSIKPAFNTYSFGGGGGWLEVSSALVDIPPGGTNLSVAAPSSTSGSAPLTLRLNSGANTFSGGGEVNGSALIFAPGTMPANGTFSVRNGGYIGAESSTDSFLSRLAIGSSSVMVGFDTAPGGTVVPITGSIDLTKLQNTSGLTAPKVLLGTASQATLSGTITLRPDDLIYRFGAYKGGQLTVVSPLNSGSVQIGDSSGGAFQANPINPTSISTVTLSGNNSYTGGTSLLSGLLLLGNANALGTGALTISKPSTFTSGLPVVPMLGSAVDGLSVANPVTLSGANLSLTGSNSFTLTGTVSGNAGVFKTGSSTVTLTGANSFSGVSIEQGTLVLGTASSGSLGTVSFSGASGGTLRVLDSFTVGNIYADSSSARIEVAGGKTLTVSPPSSPSGSASYTPVFSGVFAPVPAGGGFELVFSGTVMTGDSVPQLRLAGQSTYSGTTRVRSGIDLTVADSAAFGQSSVVLEGGRLALASGVELANPLTLSSGTLAGEGSVTTTASISVGSGAKLQPGFDLAATLGFTASGSYSGTVLSLLGGGAYRWKIGDATAAGGEWDRIAVNGAVSIGASAAAPFTVQMAPVGALGLLSGAIAGFDPAQSYAWPILTASSISGFSAGAFVIDSSAFATLAPDYKFSLGLVNDTLGSSLVLNYNPAAVPEPSTWVMLLSGAAAGALWLRRRRS